MVSPVIVSADWVLPVSGPPIPDGAVAIEDGRILAVGPASELGEGSRFADAAVIPGFVNAHSHLEYAVYAGFGDGLADFSDWIGTPRRAQAATPLRRHGGHRAAGRRRVPRLGDHRLSATALQRRRRRLPAPSWVSGRSSTWRCSATTPASQRRAVRAERGRSATGAGRTASAWSLAACPVHASRRSVYALARRSACLWPPISRRASPRTRSCAGRAVPGSRFATCSCQPPGTTGTRRSPTSGRSAPDLVAAHCVMAEPEEIELLAEHRHRGRALPTLERAARARHRTGRGSARPRDHASGSAPTAPRRRPSFDMFDELRAAVAQRRAREQRPDAMSPRARRSSLPRSAPPRPSGWTTRSARSSPESRPISPSSVSRAPRTCRGRIRQPQSSWAGPRRGYC